MNWKLTALSAALLIAVALVGSTLAENPHNAPPAGSGGQPDKSCEDLDCSGPGNSGNAPGSAFNPDGVAGGVYSPKSQYDVACFETCDDC